MWSALLNVSLPMHVWPVSLKDFGCVVIDFHLPLALKSSPFKP
jgi:hypothetical protein